MKSASEIFNDGTMNHSSRIPHLYPLCIPWLLPLAIYFTAPFFLFSFSMPGKTSKWALAFEYLFFSQSFSVTAPPTLFGRSSSGRSPWRRSRTPPAARRGCGRECCGPRLRASRRCPRRGGGAMSQPVTVQRLRRSGAHPASPQPRTALRSSLRVAVLAGGANDQQGSSRRCVW